MKIEIGKRYIRRDGTVTPVLVPDRFNEEWACDPEKDLAYGSDSSPNSHQVFSFKETPFDLIEEHVE